MHKPTVLGIAATLMALSSSTVLAQTPPDAGSLQQQLERERAQPLPPRVAPERRTEPPPMQPGDGMAVTVREFRFAGNRLLTAAQLAPALVSYLDRPLGFSQLQAAAAAVAAVYRDAGWVVRAYLPAQDIKDGIVTVQVVEAVFGRLRVEGADGARIPAARVVSVFEARLRSGEPLNSNTVDRAQLLADDLPGVSVAGSLQPGAAPGETDLLLSLAPEALLFGDVALDNAGARSTGAERLALNLGLNSPLTVGDAWAFSGVHSRGSDYGRVAGSLPVGPHGWRVGVNLSQLQYRLVSAEFAALDARGSSSSQGVEASYPLLRSRLHNLYVALAHDRKRFDNQSAGATTTRYRLNAGTLALNGNLFDNFGGGGANTASLAYVNGKLDLAGSPNEAQDAATTRSAGHYSKLHYAWSRQQVLTASLSASVQYSGQRAGKNLDSAEKFYLGGAGGVRAYPANEGGGASGSLLNLELRWRLPRGVALAVFRDSGRVTVNRDNTFAGAPALNSVRLKGHGLALAWQPTPASRLSLAWARREGVNPNPTSNGSDQDGSRHEQRVWLSAGFAF